MRDLHLQRSNFVTEATMIFAHSILKCVVDEGFFVLFFKEEALNELFVATLI